MKKRERWVEETIEHCWKRGGLERGSMTINETTLGVGGGHTRKAFERRVSGRASGLS